MSRNDPIDFAQRLYALLPAHYRVRDAERNLPLYALLRVIGTQAANLRQDLDNLWDNFFIETCDEWVVPYIGALLGTKLLSNPVAQTNRLDVWNTIAWRRSRGTPRMLQALAIAIAGWPTGFAEFYRILGWSQNVNHLRPSAQLMPDLRNEYALSLLGAADDLLLHAADFKPSFDLDQSRVTQGSLGVGKSAWPTDGRYNIRNLGFFVHRLQVFPVFGATPAAADPGISPASDAGSYTFDPLHREAPLFSAKSAAPITRAALARVPGDFLGADLSIKRNGVPLATAVTASPALVSSAVPFGFGGRGAGTSLDADAGLRLIAIDATTARYSDFILTAEWQLDDGSLEPLGALGTRVALACLPEAFHSGMAISGPGVLRVTIAVAEPGSPWPPPPLTAPRPARFPGAVLALRAEQDGALHQADGLYVYLPETPLAPGAPVTFWVADDGSTYGDPALDVETLARSAEGQVYPPHGAEPSAVPAREFTELNRGRGGMVVTDPSRFGDLGVVFAAEVFTGDPQLLGAIPTVDASGTVFPELSLPALWPALSYAPNPQANGLAGLLDILVRTLPSGPNPPPVPLILPPAELIVVNRGGGALLVYLPEIADPPVEGVRFFVAEDGSSFYYPASDTARRSALADNSLAQLVLARAASGQVWPIAGRWPLQQRIAAARDLGTPEGAARLVIGQLGIDPERGRFALPPGDPARGVRGLSVDYVEAFSDRVGALNFNRQIDPAALATRLVSSTGDAEAGLSVVANAPVHDSLAAAVAAAQDGDIIEIVDSATYAEADPVVFADSSVQRITIRARAGNRPCFSFYANDGAALPASLMTVVQMDQLVLDGLLISGGPVVLHEPVAALRVLACTLDPASLATCALISDAPDNGTGAEFLLCRCLTGALCLGGSVLTLTAADSIIDGGGKFAVVGAVGLGSPPFAPLVPVATNATVQLERVTVFGRVFCDVLIASECLFDDYVVVEDQQLGCIRFSRYEKGSTLPRRYRCVPTEEEASSCPDGQRCLPPLFNSRRYGRPSYAQLASACPAEILTASEAGAEIGAFASGLNGVRLGNLRTKLQEFMPVGLSAVIVAVT